MAFITFQDITNKLAGSEVRARINQGFSTTESSFVAIDSRITDNENALLNKQDNMVQIACSSCTTNIDPTGTNVYEDITFDSSSIINTDYIIYDGSQKEFVVQQGFKARILGTFNLGKDTGDGTAILGVRITINGTQEGNPIGAKITTEDSSAAAYGQELKQLNSGDRIKLQVFRDASGSNLGGIRSIETFAGTIAGANISICKI